MQEWGKSRERKNIEWIV